jgi:hypothetical protein
MGIGLALLACVTGAAAFTEPIPGAVRRFGSTMPVGVAPMRSLAHRPLSVAMSSKRGQSNLQTAETEPRRELEKIAGWAPDRSGALAFACLDAAVQWGSICWGRRSRRPTATGSRCLLVWLQDRWSDCGSDAKFWGFLGAIAGWGMLPAAIKDVGPHQAVV